MKKTKILPRLLVLLVEDWVGPTDVWEVSSARPVSHRVHSCARETSRDAERRADLCIERAFISLR